MLFIIKRSGYIYSRAATIVARHGCLWVNLAVDGAVFTTPTGWTAKLNWPVPISSSLNCSLPWTRDLGFPGEPPDAKLFVLPLFPVVVLVTSLFVIIYFATKRKGGNRSNRCGGCGYNLSLNVSGICPECGSPIPDKQKKVIVLEAAAGEAEGRR
jgi:hypothetical protein